MNSDNTSDGGKAGGKSLRLVRPSVVVLCGPAACGKSTFAKRHFRPTHVVSSDWARGRVCDDERDQRFNAQAFELVHFLVEQRLTANRLCVVDSTALTAPARKELLDLAKKHQVPTTLILFNVPLETCIERDEKRERSVGRAIVERQYQAFEQMKATIHQEEFDQVVEFQDGDLERVQVEVLFRPVLQSTQRPQRPDARAPQRFERMAQPSRPRPSGPRDKGRSVSSPSVLPGAQTMAAPRPATTSGSVSAPKVATPRPAEPLPPAGGTQPAHEVHAPASPTVAKEPSLVPPAAVPSQPSPAVAPPHVPLGAEPSGGS